MRASGVDSVNPANFERKTRFFWSPVLRVQPRAVRRRRCLDSDRHPEKWVQEGLTQPEGFCNRLISATGCAPAPTARAAWASSRRRQWGNERVGDENDEAAARSCGMTPTGPAESGSFGYKWKAPNVPGGLKSWRRRANRPRFSAGLPTPDHRGCLPPRCVRRFRAFSGR
jgi:hypothetical protein